MICDSNSNSDIDSNTSSAEKERRMRRKGRKRNAFFSFLFFTSAFIPSARTGLTWAGLDWLCSSRREEIARV